MPIVRPEVYSDQEQMLRIALEGLQARILTLEPCYVVSWDPDANTCVLQPAVRGVRTRADNTEESYDKAQLIDCPIIWPQGGSFVLTFPLVEGDEVMAAISHRCVDGWYEVGGGTTKTKPQESPQFRMHSWSDAFCLAGMRSKPRKLVGISANSTQLRNESGSTRVEVTADSVNVVAANAVNVTAGGNATVTASSHANVSAGGDVVVDAGGNAEITAAGNVDVTGAMINLN